MLLPTVPADMPRALQLMLARELNDVAALPRRDFLKLTVAGGFALGVAPLAVHAQGTAPPGQIGRAHV